jgi:hypothetical protein
MLHSCRMSSSRAASWIYDVINVFIDALEMEATLLRRGDVSWRFYNQQLELIRPLGAYLTRDAQHILRDFIFARPAVVELLTPHDELRSRLEAAATVAAREILARTDLRTRVDDARRRYLLKHPKDVPTGAFPAEKHPELVVERLVNDMKELPPHHTDAAFWKAHASEFAGLVNIPVWQELQKARQALLSYDLDLISRLAEYSFKLCQEFDIPAAPSAISGLR